MKSCSQCRQLASDSEIECPACGGTIGPEQSVDGDALKGIRLGDSYELVELMGEGAMGWVYRGVQLRLGSSVAIKLMKPPLEPDESRAERFRREAQAASRLNHPHIISTIDFGETSSGLLYLVTEYIQGVTLLEMLGKEGPFSLGRCRPVMGQILDAVGESHDRGVVHRDLKPENVMVSVLKGGETFVKVLDFGIAKVLDMRRKNLTHEGQLFGTPDYMAPEQIRAQEVGPAVDIYAAGVMLFELLTGTVPYHADNIFDVMKGHLYEPAPRLWEARAELAGMDDLQSVLDKAMAKDPRERYPTALAFWRELEGELEGDRRGLGAVAPKRRVSSGTLPGLAFVKGVSPAPADYAQAGEIGFAPTANVGSSQVGSKRPEEDAPLAESSDPRALPYIPNPEAEESISRLLGGDKAGLQLLGGVGTGKTFFASRAASQARQASLPVIWVEPHPSLIPVTWWPVRSAVAQALNVPIAPSRSELVGAVEANEPLRRELAGLLELFGMEGPLADSEPDIRRCETLSALTRVLVLTARDVRLLVFEDADTYDWLSQLAVARLAAHCEACEARVLLTAEIPVVQSHEHWERVRLEPLKREDLRDVLVKAGMRGPAESLAGPRETGPLSPLYANLAIAHEDEVPLDDGLTLGDLVAARLSVLPAGPRGAVYGLGVAGVQASRSELADLVEDEDTLADSIQSLIDKGLVERPGGGAGGSERVEAAPDVDVLRFAHPVIAEVARTLMPGEVRRDIHSKRLASLGESGAPAPVVAYHAQNGGDPARAVESLRSAGEEALRGFDFRAASQLFRRAREVARWDLLVGDDSPAYLEISIRLAESLQGGGDDGAAEMVFKEIAGLAGAAKASSGAPGLRARADRGLAQIQMGQHRTLLALRTMRRAVGEAILSGDVDLMARLYLDLGNLLDSAGDPDSAFAEMEEGLSLVTGGKGVDAEGGADILWKLVARMADMKLSIAQSDSALDEVERLIRSAMEHAAEVGSRLGEARANELMARVEERRGHHQRADAFREGALAILREMGDRRGQAVCLLDMTRIGSGSPERYRRLCYEMGTDSDWCEEIRRAESENEES